MKIYNSLLFFFIFMLVKKIKTLNNSFTLLFNYPVTSLVLSNSDIIYNFRGTVCEQEWMSSFCVQKSTNTFEIYIYSFIQCLFMK